MISEEEAFWAGIAVAVMMLGGGFSMLFLQAYTGYGAVVLALGLLTMALTMQMRAKPIEQIEAMASFESRVLTPTPPIESPRETVETQPTPEPAHEVETEPSQSSESTESAEPEPSEPAESVEPVEHVEPTEPAETPTAEPIEPSQQQAPIEEETESPKGEEKPQEEPVVVPPPNY